jgi:hypothetical protein
MGVNKDKEIFRAETQKTQEKVKSCLCALCARQKIITDFIKKYTEAS